MVSKELYFDVIKPNMDTTILKFNSSDEAKTAYRAIARTIGTSPGISLRARPEYAIVLDRVKGGFLLWTQQLMSFVFEVSSGRRYKILLEDGSLSSKTFNPPMVRPEDAPWNT